MKLDMHTHSYYSYDGAFSPEALISAAKKKGLDGIALTDHDTVAGWERAKKTADGTGAFLILGEEIRIKEKGKTIAEILGYFLKEKIDGKNKTIGQIVDEIRKQGGIAVLAHPFNWRKPFHELEEYKNIFDAIEVFNSRSQTSRGNKRAQDFVNRNNLAFTAGTDAHSPFEIGKTYIEAEAKNADELKEAILNKKIKIISRQGTLSVYPALGKLMHFFWKP